MRTQPPQKTKEGRVKLRQYVDWLNSLEVQPGITNVFADLRSGVVLCRIMEALVPGLKITGVYPKPLVTSNALSNIEKAISIVWQRGVNAHNMPSSAEVHEGKFEAISGLLHELFDVFVMRDLRPQYHSMMWWYHQLGGSYSKTVIPPHMQHQRYLTVAAHGEMLEQFADCSVWLCALHMYQPELVKSDVEMPLATCYWSPANHLESALNVTQWYHHMERLDLKTYFTEQEFIKHRNADFLFVQTFLLYQLLKDLPRRDVDANLLEFKDTERLVARIRHCPQLDLALDAPDNPSGDTWRPELSGMGVWHLDQSAAPLVATAAPAARPRRTSRSGVSSRVGQHPASPQTSDHHQHHHHHHHPSSPPPDAPGASPRAAPPHSAFPIRLDHPSPPRASSPRRALTYDTPRKTRRARSSSPRSSGRILQPTPHKFQSPYRSTRSPSPRGSPPTPTAPTTPRRVAASPATRRRRSSRQRGAATPPPTATATARVTSTSQFRWATGRTRTPPASPDRGGSPQFRWATGRTRTPPASPDRGTPRISNAHTSPEETKSGLNPGSALITHPAHRSESPGRRPQVRLASKLSLSPENAALKCLHMKFKVFLHKGWSTQSGGQHLAVHTAQFQKCTAASLSTEASSLAHWLLVLRSPKQVSPEPRKRGPLLHCRGYVTLDTIESVGVEDIPPSSPFYETGDLGLTAKDMVCMVIIRGRSPFAHLPPPYHNNTTVTLYLRDRKTASLLATGLQDFLSAYDR